MLIAFYSDNHLIPSEQEQIDAATPALSCSEFGATGVYTVTGPLQNPSATNQPEVRAYQVQP